MRYEKSKNIAAILLGVGAIGALALACTPDREKDTAERTSGARQDTNVALAKFYLRESVAIRDTPATNDTVQVIHQGDSVYSESEFRRFDHITNWQPVFTSKSDSDTVGWVPLSVLAPQNPKRSKRYIWSTANIRGRPSTAGKVDSQLTAGTEVWASNNGTKKWRIIYHGKSGADTVGFVHSSLLHERPKWQAESRARRRKRYAEKVERRMLMSGDNVTVEAVGDLNRTIEIRWRAANRATAFQLRNSPDVKSHLKEFGFNRLVISNGFGETWSWNVEE